MKKGIKISVVILLLLLTGCTIGGSFFMLNYSLRPEAKIRAKNADSYPFMYENYPFLRPWVDSLNQAHALRDTFVLNPEGIRLHAYYIAAPQPTKKTAVIVHGYTDNAIHVHDRLSIQSRPAIQCAFARPATSGRERWTGHSDGMERPSGRNAMDAHRQ